MADKTSSTPDLEFNYSVLDKAGIAPAKAESLVAGALHGAEDGELYAEYCLSESLVFDDGRLKAANFDTNQGFGLRAVMGETQGFAHSSELSEGAIKRASAAIQAVKSGNGGQFADGPRPTNQKLYEDADPIGAVSFEDKVALLKDIDAYARNQDDAIRQVSCSLASEWQAVEIVRGDGRIIRDIRPLVRLNVSVVMADGDRQESGSEGRGGRVALDTLISPDEWHNQVDEAIRQARVNLQSVNAPAGEMTVVLGPGWPGILLHEAIGHGLEGDFNRKKTSAFAGLLGQRVASPGVTVVDDGTLASRRGSLAVDDEGTPTSCTTLIEDGILKGYMHDRMNARLMGHAATGNGRRQSHAHQPMPRMTNTIMMGGNEDPQEILRSVKDGLYAVSFGGGQVDITSGKFVFSCTEAYQVKDGKIGAPVKGATLIGNGPDVLTRVKAIGNDMKLDPGIGTCGKAGQGVPVGVGQPTLLLDGLTVGGTAA